MDREKVIIMIERLSDGRGGDVGTLKKFLRIENHKSQRSTGGRWWIWPMCICYLVVLYYESKFASGSSVGYSDWVADRVPGWFWYGVIPVQSIPFLWIAYRYGPRRKRDQNLNPLGLNKRCPECANELTRVESVLGRSLWVGPAKCPQCRLSYPAIGIPKDGESGAAVAS